MTFVADTINFGEIVMKEPLPLATIQIAVIDFLRGRDDVVLFGAQAVNAYVSEPRATQDVDLMSTRASELAEELRGHLSQVFHIATRVRVIKEGAGYRIFQLQKTGNRHLVDVRSVASFPQHQRLDGVLVLSPAELIASKVISYRRRLNKQQAQVRYGLARSGVASAGLPATQRRLGPSNGMLAWRISVSKG